MKHIMCVRLKQWSIDRCKRRRARHDPLVLIRTVGQQQRVVAACAQARSHGIAPGMTLAQARALCGVLVQADDEPGQDARGLEALARWLFRFSPTVAIEPPAAVILDVSGSRRLYGSWEQLLARVASAMVRLGFQHRVAIAPTVGAAWAWASFGDGSRVIEKNGLPEALASLPVAALRLNIELVEAFRQLGIERIGQLSALPREVLPARFGPAVLRRLDEAFGLIDEPLVPLVYREPIAAYMEFEAALVAWDTIWEAFKLLLDQVLHQLQRRACGARKLVVEFSSPPAPLTRRTIDLSRPTADRALLFNLLRCATEHVRSDDGFSSIRLSVPVFEPLPHQQGALLDAELVAATDAYGHLLERLRARMGQGTVLLPRLADSHLPERAFCYAEAVDDPPPRPVIEPIPARPLRVLPEPREVHCMASQYGVPLHFTDRQVGFNLIHVRGPERITGLWWEGRNKTRDYFDVEDEGGRRWWLFRVLENRRWFLHGMFD